MAFTTREQLEAAGREYEAQERVTARFQARVVKAAMKTAGWWAIGPEGEMTVPPVDKGGLMNAVPGTDPDNGANYLGDGPLDMRIDFLEKLDQVYRAVWDRPVTVTELKHIMEVPCWVEDNDNGKLWPMNQWVDVAAQHMGVSQSVVLKLPEDSLKDARRLWREHRNSGIQVGMVYNFEGGFPGPTEESLNGFLSHIESAFSLHYVDAREFAKAMPADKIPSWAKESSMPLSDTLASRVAARHLSKMSADLEGDTTGDGGSVGLFIPLPAELAAQYPSLGDEDSSPPHVTLLYVGEVTPDQEEQFLHLVAEVLAAEPGPIKAWTAEVDKFSHPDKGREVFFTPIRFSRDVGTIRDRLSSALTDAGFTIKNSFPLAFSPHTTLAYVDGLDMVWDGEVPNGAWEFNSIQVWGLPGDHEIGLGEYASSHSLSFLEKERVGLLEAYGDFLESGPRR
jgi:2'-5' RNA ligase